MNDPVIEQSNDESIAGCNVFNENVKCLPAIRSVSKQSAKEINKGSTDGGTEQMPVFVPTTYVWIRTPSGDRVQLVTLLDDGSDLTLISSEACERLGLNCGEPFTIQYSIVGGSMTATTRKVEVEVEGLDGKRWKIQALAMPGMNTTTPGLPGDFFERNQHLKEVNGLLPDRPARIEMLIGYQHKTLTLPESSLMDRKDPEGHPVALRTPVGWIMYSPFSLKSGTDIAGAVNMTVTRTSETTLDEQFRRWCEGELLGVEPTSLCNCSPSSIEESTFLRHVKSTIRRTPEGRLEVHLPWKDGYPEKLRSNRVVADATTRNLEKTLERKGLQEAYAEEMRRIINEYCEPVPYGEQQ